MFIQALSERVIIALIILLLALALTVSTFGLEFADLGGAFDPNFFPRIILFCWIGLAFLNVAADLRESNGWEVNGFLKVIPMAGLMVIYVYFLTTFGFFACSVVLSVIFLVILGVRNSLAIFSVSIGVPGALVALFNHVLKMPLPISPVFWWI